MRLPYIPDPPNFPSPTDRAIEQRVRERRGPRGLLELDRTLLHAPPVADGWNSFLLAVRTRTFLPASVRELAICRVAVLNRAAYEWEHHAPLLRATVAADDADADADELVEFVRRGPAAVEASEEPSLSSSSPPRLLDERHAAALAYTDWMTLRVAVPQEAFERVRGAFSEREVVELTATVAAYNCVSRFLVALDVGERNGVTPDPQEAAEGT